MLILRVQKQFNPRKHEGKKNDVGGGDVVNGKMKNTRKRKSWGRNRRVIWRGDGRQRASLSDGLQVLPARPSELGFQYFYRII